MDVMNAGQDGWMETNKANHLCSHVCLIISLICFMTKEVRETSHSDFVGTCLMYHQTSQGLIEDKTLNSEALQGIIAP